MGKDYLFVYGTLRKDYGLELIQELKDLMLHTGQGVVKAALYDLGAYPAAVKDGRPNIITGDVYEIKDAEVVFAVLDDYEGEAYQREKTVVLMKTGDKIEAFIYWYIGRTNKALLVEDDDYLNYLKNKKDRFL